MAKCTKHHPGHPGPSERTLHLVKRNVKEQKENEAIYKA